MTLGSVNFSLFHYGLSPLLLWWEFYAFDHNQYKWKMRRVEDLSQRKRIYQKRFLAPEGATITWG